tara:strand:+ start:1540 stop:1728 length:189 start_codon:yes stop_codon:yes gene_type:complete
MKKLFSVAFVVSILHLFEDFSLVLIGRYTEVHIGIVLIAVVLFGLLIGALARLRVVKKFLGE